MSFDWNPKFPSEWVAYERPPLWSYLVLYVAVEGFAVALMVSDLREYRSLPGGTLLRYAVVIPFFGWLALSCAMYWLVYDIPALRTAEHNTVRWYEISNWQRRSREGMAVLDSVIFTPEPELAERMLKLEGEPPANHGKVMALAGMEAADDGSRLNCLLDALLAPLAAGLARAAQSGSFEIVVQCDHEVLSNEVPKAWSRLGLPGEPVVRWLDNSREVGFADTWFEARARPYGWHAQDGTPKYRLVLAWHLNKSGPDVRHTESEAAVALLLGSPVLMDGKPDLKRQAWLLRQITGDADRVERSLEWLLEAGQVPVGRISHFWHSRLKGLAQHATLGAVRERGLKVEEHALDPAIGPQAPVARWVIQALAARMAHFGQGPQLVALPHEQGVALNLVAKDPAPVDVPWQKEYDYGPLLGPECGALMSFWVLIMLLSLGEGWNTADTFVTCVVVFFMLILFFVRHRWLVGLMMESIADRWMSYFG